MIESKITAMRGAISIARKQDILKETRYRMLLMALANASESCVINELASSMPYGAYIHQYRQILSDAIARIMDDIHIDIVMYDLPDFDPDAVVK